MKKIFLSIIICLVAMMNAAAAEQELWTGSWSVSWEAPEGDEHREWKGISPEQFAEIEAGSNLFFYFEVETEAEYHKYNFDTYAWTALPGHEAEHADDFSFSADAKVKFELSQEVKDAIAADGFAIHGHGFKVVKVTLETGSDEPAEAADVLWEGKWFVSWDLPDGDEHKEWKGIDQETFASFAIGEKLYLTFELDPESEYHEYKIDDWGWNVLPGQKQTALTADTDVELTITQEIKDAVAANGFAVHGHGFFVTKARVASTPTAIDHTYFQTNGVRYNLLGQPVGENYKGVVILNGKKMIQH